jgi:hypothetical protein
MLSVFHGLSPVSLSTAGFRLSIFFERLEMRMKPKLCS